MIQARGNIALHAPQRHAASLIVRNPIAQAYKTALLLILPLILFYISIAESSNDTSFYEQVNGTAPLYLIAVLLMIVYRVVRRCPALIWTPVVWLPLQSAVFFGFGPLVEVYGHDATIEALAVHRLAITQADLLRTNTLSTIGIWLVLAGVWFHSTVNNRDWADAVRNRPTGKDPVIPPATVALWFVVGGAILKYAFIMPAAWGMIDITIPGVIHNLESIIDVGFALMAWLSVQGNKRMRVLFTILWPIHLFLCVLSFSKLQLIFALLLPAIGAYVGHQRLSRLGVYFLVMGIVFVLAQPFVHYGRSVIISKTGGITKSSYQERIQIVISYATDKQSIFSSKKERQGWWTRLSFAGPQAFAMHAHDNGMHGNSLKDAWMLFIPRAIWPEKPIIIGPGAEFYSLVTWREGTSFLALSVYGDLYWQFGWWGVILVCPLIGYFFSIIAIHSLRVIVSREFILFPAVLIGMGISILGLNKYLVNGIIGAIPIYAAYLISMNWLIRFLREKNELVTGKT